MDGSIDAIFDGNVFHPVTPAPLPDGTKITFTFEVLDEASISGERRELFLSAEERLRQGATEQLLLEWAILSWKVSTAAAR